MRRAGKSGIFSKIYLAFIVALMYIPVILTVIYSFNANKSPTVWGGFSMKWYEELAGDRSIREAFGKQPFTCIWKLLFCNSYWNKRSTWNAWQTVKV